MWLPEDSGYVLALAEVERGECNGCGGWLPDTTDVDKQLEWVAHERICYACDARDRRAKALNEGGGPGVGGLMIGVSRG